MNTSSLIVMSRIAAGVLFACLSTFQATAQTASDARAPVSAEPASTTATYGDWVVRCVQLPAPENGKAARASRSCETVQTVQVQGQQQPVAQLAIGRLPEDRSLVVTAVVPVNIAFPGMIHVSGNGKTGSEEKGSIDLVWQKCFAGSCAANGKPDDATLAALRGGTQGQLRFADANGNLVSVPLSWRGLDQALAALERNP